MSKSLTIVDPHIHLWDLRTGIYPHFEKPSDTRSGSNAAIARSYLIDEFLKEAGPDITIKGMVHVEAFPTDPVKESSTLQKVADTSRVPLGLVAHADLTAADFPALMDAHAAFPILRGIRQVVNRHPDPKLSYVKQDLMGQPVFLASLRELGRRDLSFDLQLFPHQMAEAANLASASPDTQIILNHAGMWVDRNLNGWRDWKAGLRALAARPNVAVKISGIGMLDTHWTNESMRPLVLETLEAFGLDRAMFASNFPVDKLTSTYPAIWQSFSDITEDLGNAERAGLFSANAEKFYRMTAA